VFFYVGHILKFGLPQCILLYFVAVIGHTHTSGFAVQQSFLCVRSLHAGVCQQVFQLRGPCVAQLLSGN